MKAIEEWLYGANDWILYAIVCCLALGAVYVFCCWMFRGSEITPETRKELHDALER